MIPPSASEQGTSLMAIECSLTLLAITLGLLWPHLGSRLYSTIERQLGNLARKRGLAVLTVGVSALMVRLALLPLNPIPHPFILDSFSYLLAGDTFASGRLTNPTPAMWRHFESFQITMQPTYMSMYFPAHGMVLAAGKLLTGNPWFGLLVITALMCAAICWMLQAWLPATWAFLGGMLAVMHLGLFSYWIDTYSGGGAIAALGGALVLGAFPRITRSACLRDLLLLSAGAVILMNSRPYEGLLLCLPVAVVLLRWFFVGVNRPAVRVLLRRAVAPVALIVAAVAWMGYYNYRVFGNALTEPYTVNRATYAAAPHFLWQSPHPEPVYRHAVMRDFYTGWELGAFQKVRTLPGFFSETPLKLIRAILFYAGIVLLPPIVMSRRVFLDRRTRFLVLAVGVLAIGMLMETWLIPHYLAPFTAAFYALGLQAARHLRVWTLNHQPAGQAMVRLLVTVCVLLVGLRSFAAPLHLRLAGWPTWTWYGSRDFGAERGRVLDQLNHLPGKQLAIVRYARSHNSLDEWVYNAADIDNSQVIWARAMDPRDDLELIQYYKGRNVWLIQPDRQPATITPYELSEPENAALRNSRPMNEPRRTP